MTPTPEQVAAIARALRAQRQVDKDGIECGVSRQAVDEAAAILESLSAAPAPQVAAAPAIASKVEELNDEQVIDFAVKAGLHDEMWFGPHTPPSCEDTLPKLRRFAELLRATLSASIPPVREGLSEERIAEIATELFATQAEQKEGAWGPESINAAWLRHIAIPLARAIEREGTPLPQAPTDHFVDANEMMPALRGLLALKDDADFDLILRTVAAIRPVGHDPYTAPAAQAQEPAAEAVFLIYFDDADCRPQVVIGEAAARKRFADVSISWNAHLFGKIESNCRDDRYHSANVRLTAPSYVDAATPSDTRSTQGPGEALFSRPDQPLPSGHGSSTHRLGSRPRLNPAFGCKLMGWPCWWTNPGVTSSVKLEMVSYRSALQQQLSRLLAEPESDSRDDRKAA